MDSNEDNLNIIVGSEDVPIHVTEDEYFIFKKAKVIEDVRHTYAMKKWSKLIKEQSNFICECCGSKEKLEAHHIFSFKYYPALSLDLKNGICLCRKCHKEYHSIYKLKDTSPYSLFNFIKNHHDNK